MQLGLSSIVAAQTPSPLSGSHSSPILGGPSGATSSAKIELFGNGQNATTQMHVGPTNKPCLTFQGYVEQQKINNNLFNHLIIVSNECSQVIKVDLCYYKSQHCTSITVASYGRKEVTLGIMPAMKDFRFDYREQFDQGSVLGGAGSAGRGPRSILGIQN